MSMKVLFTAALILIVSSGCATVPARNPVPPELVDVAGISGMEEVRIMAGGRDTKLQESLLSAIRQETPEDFPAGPDGIRTYPVLAISGGGARGAYGAGLLKGWTKEGTRPVFKIVTGVSTGSIIAPFAFLGKDYDGKLERLYTAMSTKDVLRPRGISGFVFGDSLADTAPLKKTLTAAYDDKLIAEVARQHKRGRRLFVGTANLDAQRFVVWDMGAIAVRGDAALFRKVIVASCAIPVTFPPVFFRVDAGGRSYDEMHVDGGTLARVFTACDLPEQMSGAVKRSAFDSAKARVKLYVIWNGYIYPDYAEVEDDVASIAQHSLDAAMDSAGLGEVRRIYHFMKERDWSYNLAFIPDDFRPEEKEAFDPYLMKRLFDKGYADASSGYDWHKSPPA